MKSNTKTSATFGELSKGVLENKSLKIRTKIALTSFMGQKPVSLANDLEAFHIRCFKKSGPTLEGTGALY